MAKPTTTQIDNLINELIDEPGPRWPAMTYEQGLRAALDWILDEGDHPLDEDD